MTPRRWFHVLLGAIFLPGISLPLVWGAAIYWFWSAVDEQQRLWAKRMVALALFDSLVLVAGGVSLAARLGHFETRFSERETDRVVIGVAPDWSFGGPGARVRSVNPASPAGAAGLRAGDVVLRVAGKETNGASSLRTVVGEQRAGAPITFELKREGTVRAVEVTPVWSSEIPSPKTGLFEPQDGREACFADLGAPTLLPWAVILGAVFFVGVLAARRGLGSGVWWTAASLVAATVGAYAAYGGACVVLRGPTFAGGAFSLWGSSLGLASVALVGLKLSSAKDQPDRPTRSWGSTLGFGCWYTATGAIRLSVLLWAAILVLPAVGEPLDPVASLGQNLGTMHGAGLLLLALPLVVFCPVGEEAAFRGLLLPALGRWMTPKVSIAVSAALFASLHWYYGVMLPQVFLFGLILGWARVVSGGLRAPIALHMLINAVSLLPITVQAMAGG